LSSFPTSPGSHGAPRQGQKPNGTDFFDMSQNESGFSQSENTIRLYSVNQPLVRAQDRTGTKGDDRRGSPKKEKILNNTGLAAAAFALVLSVPAGMSIPAHAQSAAEPVKHCVEKPEIYGDTIGECMSNTAGWCKLYGEGPLLEWLGYASVSDCISEGNGNPEKKNG